MSDNDKKKEQDVYAYDWSQRNWRAWGSWFSWGSPIGLALFYAIVLLSTGAFIWILNNL